MHNATKELPTPTRSIVTHFFHGIAIGVANIIPGVSGGTIALLLGIYERLISAIGRFDTTFAHDATQTLLKNRAGISQFLRRYDLIFLITLAAGALIAVVASSALITHLLIEHHDATYAFFFGLVLASILVPLQMLKQRPALLGLVMLVVATAGAASLSLSMSGEKKLVTEQRKYAAKQVAQKDVGASASVTQDRSLPNLAFFFFAGAIAMSAMILPGISGSFMLLVLGVYFDILQAIAARDVLVIGIVALGCGFGLLAFTKGLSYVLKHHHDATVMGLVGLMLGSLYGLWPFQQYAMVGPKRVDIAPVWPSLSAASLVAGMMFLCGVGLVLLFVKFGPKKTI